MTHQTVTPLSARARALVAGLALATIAATSLWPRALGSHEVPERVAIIAFVQPTGHTLRVVARVPLEAMRDLDFPLRLDGSLDVGRTMPLLPQAATLWVADYLAVFEDGVALPSPAVTAVRIARPDDRAFEEFSSALGRTRGAPVVEFPGLRWQQALFDLVLEYPITSASARFAVEPRLAHLGQRTTTVLRLVLPAGGERVFRYTGDPGRIELDPSWLQAAGRFVVEGFGHILGGIDHLLFVLCLVLPVRRWRSLIAIITAFTLAHSLTLGAAALGYVPTALWFPPLVEAVIALSIVVLAIENLLLPEDRLANRWRTAFVFGLVHGFGFAFALGDALQFAGRHLVTSLAAFNVGVELGQLLVLVAAVPLLGLARRYVGAAREHLVAIVGSVLVAHTAWHWMTDRFTTLAEFRASFTWPVLDAQFALGAMRLALLAAVALALAMAIGQIVNVFTARRAPGGREDGTRAADVIEQGT